VTLDEKRHFSAGSRNSDGNVPRANFNRDNGKVYVNNDNPMNRNAISGSRRIVSNDLAVILIELKESLLCF